MSVRGDLLSAVGVGVRLGREVLRWVGECKGRRGVGECKGRRAVGKGQVCRGYRLWERGSRHRG